MSTPEQLRKIASEANDKKAAERQAAREKEEQKNIKCAEPFVVNYRAMIFAAAKEGNAEYVEHRSRLSSVRFAMNSSCKSWEIYAGLASIFRKEGFNTSTDTYNGPGLWIEWKS